MGKLGVGEGDKEGTDRTRTSNGISKERKIIYEGPSETSNKDCFFFRHDKNRKDNFYTD